MDRGEKGRAPGGWRAASGDKSWGSLYLDVVYLDLESTKLPNHIRHINFPGVSASIQELMDALAKYGGEEKLKLLKEETKPDLERILRSWPQDFDTTTPVQKLGLTVDERAEDLVKEYIDSLKN